MPCSFCTKTGNFTAFPRKPSFPFFRENCCNLLQNNAFSHFVLSRQIAEIQLFCTIKSPKRLVHSAQKLAIPRRFRENQASRFSAKIAAIYCKTTLFHTLLYRGKSLKFSYFAQSNHRSALFILHKNPRSCGVSEKIKLPDFPRKMLQFTAKQRFFTLCFIAANR